MSQKFYTVVTNSGLAKLAEASQTQSKIQFTHIAIGDGNGQETTPSPALQGLVNEVYRVAVSSAEVDNSDSTQVIAEAVLKGNIGDFTMREIGLYDSTGTLIAVGNLPATTRVSAGGIAQDQVIRMIIKFSNAANVVV